MVGECWEELFNRHHPNSHQTTCAPFEKSWSEVFAACRCVQAASVRGDWQSIAWLAYCSHITIPAQSEVMLWAKVPSHPCRQQCALVEPLEGVESIEVARTLVTLKKGRFPIRVRNINPFPTVLHRFQKVDNVCSVLPEQVRADREMSLIEVCPGVLEVGLVDVGEEVTEAQGENTGPPSLKSDCLSWEQQLQLDHIVQKCDHVFSKHEEDYGRTGTVKHRIPTGNAEPTKERYRPIPLTLYKEIHGLLQGITVWVV